MKSLVVIAPSALWPTVRVVNNALGYEAGEGVPLAPEGSAETHRGLHTWATDGFVAIATGAAPADVPGFPPEQVAGFLAMLTVSVDANGLTALDHFNHVCDGMSLVRIELAD